MIAPCSSSSFTEKKPSPLAMRAAALCKSIDGRLVLNSIDLSIAAGEFVAILGINGAGKTTLLKILATLMAPSAGQLHLFGLEVPRHAVEARARLGLIGHQSMLYRDLTARENLELFARLYGVDAPRRRAEELLTIVGLIDRADNAVNTFSRGMCQRLSIARALVHQPDLVLADEPFAGLDVPGAFAVEQLLSELHADGKTIVMVNHDVQQSLRLAERVIVLGAGTVLIDHPARVADAPAIIAELAGADPQFQDEETPVR
jgi:ABC-type multidrug transport system ATPase subunit